VTNEKNGRSVEVRITDRGPYGGGRVIDLSEAAARTIGIIDAGVARVRIEIVAEP
jgi:rare lipoprotein A